MKTIYLNIDRQSVTPKKVERDILGGTERFFLLWKKHLQEIGYFCFSPPEDNGSGFYDLVIHSNVPTPPVNATKSILWAGSWHAGGYLGCDVTICNSPFFKEQMKWDKALVIPAPFDERILTYRHSLHLPGVIVSNSNPNRYYGHMLNICAMLEEKQVSFEWRFTGGNRLYSDEFSEPTTFGKESKRLKYYGPVPRQEMLGILTSAHVWAYPNFTDNSETLCVAAMEALALGIPTLLPKRKLFLMMYPEADLCSNEREMMEKILYYFEHGQRWDTDMSRYSSRVIFPQLDEVVKTLIGLPDDTESRAN